MGLDRKSITIPPLNPESMEWNMYLGFSFSRLRYPYPLLTVWLLPWIGSSSTSCLIHGCRIYFVSIVSLLSNQPNTTHNKHSLVSSSPTLLVMLAPLSVPILLVVPASHLLSDNRHSLRQSWTRSTMRTMVCRLCVSYQPIRPGYSIR